MEAKSRVLGGVLLAGAIVGAIWLFAGDGGLGITAPSTQQPPPKTAAPVASTSAATSDVAAAPDAAMPRTATAERTEVVAPDAKNATLCGRCVDAAGVPLAGCTLQLHGAQADRTRIDHWLLDHTELPAWQVPAAVTTGSDGRFSITFLPPPPWQFSLVCTLRGFGAMRASWTTLAEGSTTDVGDIVMRPGLQVTGRVTDTDGVPQADAEVKIDIGKAPHPDPPYAVVGANWGEQDTTGPDGSFATTNWLAPGTYLVRIQDRVLVSREWIELEASLAAQHLELVVKKQADVAVITGRVLDDAGAPVQGVVLFDGVIGDVSHARTGRDGTFVMRRTHDQAATMAHLVLSVDGYEFDKKSRAVPWGSHDVELRVTRGGALTIRVTDAADQPIESYRVRLISRERGSWDSGVGTSGGDRQHENGTTVIASVASGDYVVAVDFPADAGFESLFVSHRQEGNGRQRLDLRANRAAHRSLRVMAGDAPIAGTRVQLCELFGGEFDDHVSVANRDVWEHNSIRGHALILFDDTTDADGRVELRGPGDRELGLCVLGPGHVPVRQGGVRLDVPGELVMQVSRGARLVGKIVPPEAVAELKRRVVRAPAYVLRDHRRPRLQLSRTEPKQRFPDSEPAASEFAGLFFDDDGNLDAAGLPPGTWNLAVSGLMESERLASERTTSPHEYPAGSAILVDNQTTHHDFDLQAIVPGILEGTVLMNGTPLVQGIATLQGDNNWFEVKTDTDGHFTKACEPGDYELFVPLLTEARADFTPLLYCPTRGNVVRGTTTPFTFAVASGRLNITALDDKGEPVPAIEVHVRSETTHRGSAQTALPRTDTNGMVDVVWTAETITLRVLPKALASTEAQVKLMREGFAAGIHDPLESHFVTLTSVTIVQGQTKTIQLHLPTTAGY